MDGVRPHADPNMAKIDRFIGVLIWLVQLLTYAIFIQQSIKETRDDQVAVTITHATCYEHDGIPMVPEIHMKYQKLFSGTLVDGIAAGMGLVFVYEMGNKAYHAIVYQMEEDKNPQLFLILIFVLTCLSFVPVFTLDTYL